MVSSSAGQMDSLALSSRAEDFSWLPLLGALVHVPCGWLLWLSQAPSCFGAQDQCFSTASLSKEHTKIAKRG